MMEGKIIQFRKKDKRDNVVVLYPVVQGSPVYPPIPDPNFIERLNRIKASLERINRLLAEMRKPIEPKE